MKKLYFFIVASLLCAVTARAEYSAADFAGAYDWRRSIDGWSETVTTPVTITVGEEENTLLFHGLWDQSVVHATFDPVKNYINIPNQLVDADNDVWLKSACMDMSTFTIVTGEGPCRLYPSDGDLVYEDMDGFGFFKSDDTALAYCLDPVFYLTVSLLPDEWNVLGKAGYTDGWVAPGLTVAVPSYEVTVWQNIADPNLYAVVNPYGHNTPFAQYNLDPDGEGFIIIDVSDPTCVMVKLRIFSGMTVMQNGYRTDMYNFNMEALYHTLSGMGNEEIVAKLESEGLQPSTFKDDVITIHNCIFADQDDLYESYTFDETLKATSVIRLPKSSLNVIGEDIDRDSPAEYYNLQGIRVADPAPGAVYIRRQGRSVKKIRL